MSGNVVASTETQYLVPKDGSPLAGLIQDYMVSGVWLMILGQFFTYDDYQQLVYAALVNHPQRVKHIKPAIVKPVCLWSGKQVCSCSLYFSVDRLYGTIRFLVKSHGKLLLIVDVVHSY